MIFISVGTHYLQFDRLLKFINQAVENGAIREPVHIQSGTSTINVKNSVQKPFFEFDEMNKEIRQARVVVCHAGPATIYQVLMFGKKPPIVMPRLSKFGEHVSDHQLYFAKLLARKKKIYLAQNYKELIEDIQDVNGLPEDRPIFRPKNNSDLHNKLCNYLRKLQT